MTNPKTAIPHQHSGIAKEVHHHVNAQNEQAAARLFNQAKARLLDVNHWDHFKEGLSATFRLCNAAGQPIQRPARSGDYVCINIPAPGRASDSGYDWVVLEAVEEGENEEGPWITLTTRPASDPTAADTDTAHFFDNASTGTFIIHRKGRRVEASHYGRNEGPNTEGGSLLDKARAVAITIGAYFGLSDVQWKGLIEGLLMDTGEED